MDIRITKWSEAAFAEARRPWNRLLGRSEADPLFLSWQWQHSWWRAFGKSLGELNILAAYLNDELVGLAPLYLRSTRLRGWWPIRRLQFIGNCWRDLGTMRSEHLEFIVHKDFAQVTTVAIFRNIVSEGGYDELVLTDTKTGSDTHRVAMDTAALGYGRKSVPASSYYIDTTGSFEQYLATLGKGHQKRLFKQRKRLETLGDVVITTAPEAATDRYLETLDRLHSKRWGGALFNPPRWQFHRSLIQLLQGEGGVELSMLSVDAQPVSMLYVLTAGGYQYYLQGGFDEQFGKGIAVNSLHLGYVIEQAFLRGDVERFYLLAGGGKNTAYKQHLTSEMVTIEDIQFVRAPLLKLAYATYDLCRRRRTSESAVEGVETTSNRATAAVE